MPWAPEIMTLNRFSGYKIRPIELAWYSPDIKLQDYTSSGLFNEALRRLTKTHSVSHQAPQANLSSPSLIRRQRNLGRVVRRIEYLQREGVKLHVVDLAVKERQPISQILHGNSGYDSVQVFESGMASALDLKRRVDAMDGTAKIGFKNLSSAIPAWHDPNDFKDLVGGNYGLVVSIPYLVENGLAPMPTIDSCIDHVFEVHVSTITGTNGVRNSLEARLDNTAALIDHLNDQGFGGRLIVKALPPQISPVLDYLRMGNFI